MRFLPLLLLPPPGDRENRPAAALRATRPHRRPFPVVAVPSPRGPRLVFPDTLGCPPPAAPSRCSRREGQPSPSGPERPTPLPGRPRRSCGRPRVTAGHPAGQSGQLLRRPGRESSQKSSRLLIFPRGAGDCDLCRTRLRDWCFQGAAAHVKPPVKRHSARGPGRPVRRRLSRFVRL